VREPSDAALIRTLQRDLDQGEAEAIALAVEVSASLILLDEQEGRKRARTLDLPITGAIGVLLKAYQMANLTRSVLRSTPYRRMPASGWPLRYAPAFCRKSIEQACRPVLQ
jgi:predicted nucleic acid-binding protein